ncbi:hypothetical protein S245_047559, partial [Arachis hypogaea]
NLPDAVDDDGSAVGSEAELLAARAELETAGVVEGQVVGDGGSNEVDEGVEEGGITLIEGCIQEDRGHLKTSDDTGALLELRSDSGQCLIQRYRRRVCKQVDYGIEGGAFRHEDLENNAEDSD